MNHDRLTSILVLGFLASILGSDGALVHHHRQAYTGFLRQHRRSFLAGEILLACHVLQQPRFLARFDPFAIAARMLAS